MLREPTSQERGPASNSTDEFGTNSGESRSWPFQRIACGLFWPIALSVLGVFI